MQLNKYLHALKWEFLQNLPLILGFMVASRLRHINLLLSLEVLVVGIFLGITLMHYTEPFLHKEKYPSTWRADFFNFALFVIMAIPFLFYFSVEHPLLNWLTDLIVGAILGVLLTFGQALTWKGPKARMVVHGIAMAVSFPLILVGIRYAFKVTSWGWMVILGILVTLLASIVITLIDYAEMYQFTQDTIAE